MRVRGLTPRRQLPQGPARARVRGRDAHKYAFPVWTAHSPYAFPVWAAHWTYEFPASAARSTCACPLWGIYGMGGPLLDYLCISRMGRPFVICISRMAAHSTNANRYAGMRPACRGCCTAWRTGGPGPRGSTHSMNCCSGTNWRERAACKCVRGAERSCADAAALVRRWRCGDSAVALAEGWQCGGAVCAYSRGGAGVGAHDDQLDRAAADRAVRLARDAGARRTRCRAGESRRRIGHLHSPICSYYKCIPHASALGRFAFDLEAVSESFCVFVSVCLFACML